MPQSFSSLNRSAVVERLRTTTFDVVVIGGGITGAGIALDASSRGLKTALVEKDDFAFGTSSRSTKLIHGGLRYLKQLEFGLVKEVGSERAVVHFLAPHLVIPEKMLLPLYEKKGLGYWLTSIGLKVYDFLAGVKPDDQRRMLTRAQTLRREPLLKKDDVKGGAIYAEYRTDDARLTLEIIKAAHAHDAVIANYTGAIGFRYSDGQISGLTVRDHFSNEVFDIRTRTVINAAGPWVDEVRSLNRSLEGKRLHLTKGVHIVVPREKFPVTQAIYFDVEDGRMIFAIPRGRITYIGTTDTNYTGDKEVVLADPSDAEYLVRGVNATFSGIKLAVDDIESSWAGLRPLIHEDGKNASELSRKDEIFESPTGLVSIAGGKLTGYRKMAERVVNLVVRRNFSNLKLKGCHTHKLPLTGYRFTSGKEIRNYTGTVAKSLAPYPLSAYTAGYLVSTYGKQTDLILDHFRANCDMYEAELSLLKAEAWFAVDHEMITGLQDFFIRRTGLLFFEIRKVVQYKRPIAAYLAPVLGWDERRLSEELAGIESQIRNATICKDRNA